MPSTTETQDLRALAFLRISVGLFFLLFGQYKVFSTYFTLHGGFQFWIHQFLENNSAYPFMVPVLRGFVLPHATPIAFLVAYGELAIGVALTLGVLARQRRSSGIHAHAPVFLQLPRPRRANLAILRRQPRPFRARALLHLFPDWTSGVHLVRLISATQKQRHPRVGGGERRGNTPD
jgi:hypothetical protein